MLTPQEIKNKRMALWVDAVLVNLKDIEDALFKNNTMDYHTARKEILEQYRLIKLMKNVVEGKTKLDGWR